MNRTPKNRRFRLAAAVRLLLMLSILLPSLAACRQEVERTMISLPTPRNWAEELDSFRALKDDQFRNAPDTPLNAEYVPGFAGLSYWGPDGDYYFAGDLNYYAEPVELQMPDTANELRAAVRAGWIEFPIDGTVYTLQVYRMLEGPRRRGGADYFLPFSDATTGVESYETGRYVDLFGPDGGPFVLDFNRAYSPFCAYGKPYACPLTPKENRLEVRIEAGERGFKPS